MENVRFVVRFGGFKDTIGGICHVFYSVLRGFKETIGGFVSHVEMGDGVELVQCL